MPRVLQYPQSPKAVSLLELPVGESLNPIHVNRGLTILPSILQLRSRTKGHVGDLLLLLRRLQHVLNQLVPCRGLAERAE